MTGPSAPPSVRRRPLGWVVAALVLAALYALRLVVFARLEPLVAATLAAQALLTAGVLGLAVWRLTQSRRWSTLPRAARYALHAALAFGYAMVWAVALGMTTEVIASREVAHRAWVSMGWELLAGVMLYALTASAAWGADVTERFERQRALTARAEALAAEARLAALRAQLQPHFLFNALHSLSGIVHRDPAAAARGIEQLGDLLRLVLEDGRRTATVREEIHFTRQYLALERLRIGERLRVEADVESAALSWAIPLFTIQPLVENAIRHGIAPKPGPVSLTVAARVENGTLSVVVRDDGVGADPAAVAGSGGLGLRALRERLEAAYRGRARLEITTAPGAGFTARLALPLRMEGGDG